MATTAAIASQLLSMRAISKAFGGIPALASASLEVGHGEVHALVGQNGAGKSTMIKILTGYVARDKGEIMPMPGKDHGRDRRRSHRKLR